MIIFSDSLTPQMLNVYSMPGCGPGLGVSEPYRPYWVYPWVFNGVRPCICMHKFIPHESVFIKT